MKRPSIVIGLAGLTALLIFGSFLLIVFSVNPGVNRNDKEIKRAVASQHAIICAQVQNTANAYRFRSLTPSGAVEPVRHFLTRMQAQQQTLRLAKGLGCKSAPGFLSVGLQVKRALAQIRRILMSHEAKERKPVAQLAGPQAKALPLAVLQEETPYFPEASVGPSKGLKDPRGSRPPKEAPASRRTPPPVSETISNARLASPKDRSAVEVEVPSTEPPACVRVGELVEIC